MGLIKDFKNYRRHKHFLEECKIYGISEEDLKMLPTLVAQYKKPPVEYKIPDDIKKENEKNFEGKSKPVDIIKMFEGDVIRLGEEDGEASNN